ncbi:MAG TPA: hypothetical protein VD814_01970 [Nocardioides sp.]|nr:hypothetical protein [Nocardioides sp.]
MELDSKALRTAARRWDAVVDELAGARSLLRAASTGGLGPAAGEAALLLEAAVDAVARLHHDAEDLVDGLLLTAALVADTDDRVAAALERCDGAQ